MEVSVSVREVGNKKATWSLEGDLNGELSLQDFLRFTKETLLSVALDAFREEKTKGFDPKPIVVVDGKPNKSIENVSPLGKIEFISKEVASLQILQDIYEDIFRRSKIVTGTYIEGNYVFLNGKRVATSLDEMRAWIKSAPEIKQNDLVRFVNVLPYARKLERHGVTDGKTSTRDVKSKDKRQRSGAYVLAPNGVYYLASKAVTRNFKYNAVIKFGFMLGSQLDAGAFPTISKNGKPLRKNYKATKAKPKNSGPYLYPSITVLFNGGTA